MPSSKVRKPSGWPRYMREKLLRNGRGAYYWEAPHWARTYKYAPAVFAKALGPDYATAKRECDDILNPMFDAWRELKSLSDDERRQVYADQAGKRLVPGTVRWMARVFETSREFLGVSQLTQSHYREGLDLICEFKLRNDPRGRLFGDLTLSR